MVRPKEYRLNMDQVIKLKNRQISHLEYEIIEKPKSTPNSFILIFKVLLYFYFYPNNGYILIVIKIQINFIMEKGIPCH